MVRKGVPGKENSMAQGQGLEDCCRFQELNIIEHNWHLGVRQEGVVEKVLGDGGARQRAASLIMKGLTHLAVEFSLVPGGS